MASSHTSAITTSFSPFTEYRLSSRNGLSQQAHDKTQYSHRTSHHRQLDRPPLANRNGELRSAPPPAVKDTLNSQEHTSSVDLTAVRPSNGAPIPTDSCFCDGAPNPLRQTPEMRAAFVKKAIDEACVPSEDLAGKAPEVRGYDFNGGVDYAAIMRQMYTTGFQATHFGQALDWRLSDEPITSATPPQWRDPRFLQSVKAKIFLGFTSNMTSSGNREIIRYLAQHKQVDVMVSSAGGIEEDFIKCLAPTYVGSFELEGRILRARGLNRTGNLLTPNDNYFKFHDFAFPVLKQMLKEQEEEGTNWTPSKMIRRFGREINHPGSIYYWCYKNDIRVYCPSITDGSFGEILYFLHHHQSQINGPQLKLDLSEDIVAMSNETVMSPPQKRGIVILGGGLAKHHICNANLLAGGADFAVLVNTANEFDGCDSGARTDEAKSWGKIKDTAQAVKVYADATLVFPLLVAETFAPRVEAAARGTPLEHCQCQVAPVPA